MCILPIQNGTYLITKENIYCPLVYSEGGAPPPFCKTELNQEGRAPLTPPSVSSSFTPSVSSSFTPSVSSSFTPIEERIFKKDTTSSILSLGKSETSLIDNMRYSGIFEDILGEPITHGPLLNGRHRMSPIDILLGEKQIHIQGVQYETDACFESQNKILIIECKKTATKPLSSFNIRQLYFPFCEVLRVVANNKKIICAFIHQIGSSIHVWLYDFPVPNNFSSIVLIKSIVYKLE